MDSPYSHGYAVHCGPTYAYWHRRRNPLLPLPCHAMPHKLNAPMPVVPLQAYGRELSEAAEWCNKYRASRKESDLHQAWDLYYHVFKRINKQLPSLTVLELQYVAPALVRAQVSLRCGVASLKLWPPGLGSREPIFVG